MARRHHYRRRTKDAPELDVTTFLNLMVVLVPFLLITAVFSRIAIVELNLPTTQGSASSNQPNFRVEVIVREAGLEIGNGRVIIAALPKKDGEYDLEQLSRYMVSLKDDNPKTESASVLLEPTIPYDYLIQVMDAVRSVEIPVVARAEGVEFSETEQEGGFAEEAPQFQQLALFTEISVGDAP